MPEQNIAACIAGMASMTFLLRYLPLQLLAQRRLPAWLICWLRFIPASVMAAMLAQWLAGSHAEAGFGTTQQLFTVISLPVLGIAYWTRNFLATMLCGSLLAAAGRFLLNV